MLQRDVADCYNKYTIATGSISMLLVFNVVLWLWLSLPDRSRRLLPDGGNFDGPWEPCDGPGMYIEAALHNPSRLLFSLPKDCASAKLQRGQGSQSSPIVLPKLPLRIP